MNRGRHKKKKIIQKMTYEDIINYINSTKFDPYFSINEQGTTSQIMPTSNRTNIR